MRDCAFENEWILQESTDYSRYTVRASNASPSQPSLENKETIQARKRLSTRARLMSLDLRGDKEKKKKRKKKTKSISLKSHYCHRSRRRSSVGMLIKCVWKKKVDGHMAD